jgi:hypothetical protein
MIDVVNTRIVSATHCGRLNFCASFSATVFSQLIRWVRCAQPTHSITVLMIIAAMERPITWLSPAPRAGGSAGYECEDHVIFSQRDIARNLLDEMELTAMYNTTPTTITAGKNAGPASRIQWCAMCSTCGSVNCVHIPGLYTSRRPLQPHHVCAGAHR